jgi:hypothetical protein
MNEEYVDPNAQQGAYYPPQSFASDKADLLEKIRPDEIVDIYRNRLLGKEYINSKWVEVTELQRRKLSNLGAWEIANLMLSASTQNVAISNLKDREIKARTISIVRTAMKMCLRNWKEYGITSADQFYFVKEIVMTNTLVTLKQPEHEGIRKLIKGTTQESRVVQDTPQQKKGIISRMVRGFK